MLRADLDTFRLAFHILAATVWVGGQLTLVALLPVVRSLGPEASRRVAQRFSLIAWTAYAVVVLTGVWNVFHVGMADRSSEYHITLGVKLLVVGLSGAGALLHTIVRSKVALAIGGAVALVAGVASLVLGVMLRG